MWLGLTRGPPQLPEKLLDCKVLAFVFLACISLVCVYVWMLVVVQDVSPVFHVADVVTEAAESKRTIVSIPE